MVDVARKLLVGRRFIHITGPLGMGVQTWQHAMAAQRSPELFRGCRTNATIAAQVGNLSRIVEGVPILPRLHQSSSNQKSATSAAQVSIGLS